jgi:hypothetical protein
MTCNLTREQKDELCASIIKSGNDVTERYMKEHSSADVSRTASSGSTSTGIRNQVYALRQRMLGRPVVIPDVESRTASSTSRIGPNKIYELRRLMFAK